MSLPEPEPGLVIRYGYLWQSEFQAGREEGTKDRPCAIVAAVKGAPDARSQVLVLPITHSKPTNLEGAIEIPAAVKRHLGLDQDRSWIIISESNAFLWPGPDLRPVGRGGQSTFAFGFLPPSLFAEVQRRFVALERARRSTRVPRSE